MKSDHWRRERERWEQDAVAPFAARQPERKQEFETMSGRVLERVYTQEHVERDAATTKGSPASARTCAAPTRRCTGRRPWTMRQIAGFGTGEDTNGASSTSSRRARPASRPISTCPR